MSIAALIRQMRELGAPMEAIEVAVAAVEAEQSKDADRRAKRAAQKRKERAVGSDSRATVARQGSDSRSDPAPKDNNQTPTQVIPPEANASAPKGARRVKGTLCPDDFEPTERHFAKAAQRGFDRPFVISTRDRMHRWSHANAQRPVARKSDWNLTFFDFLDRAMDEPSLSHGARASPSNGAHRKTGNGRVDHLLSLMEPSSDPGPFDREPQHLRLVAGCGF